MASARAYLDGGRIGLDLNRLSDLRVRIGDLFAKAGAARVEPETLQPADLLLDLYGEDIRARAYLVHDPVAGEMVLRPDFTVPVARLHMAGGASAARYAYEGLVWRQQATGSVWPSEYLQAGVELIGGADAAADEAEVFELIRDALGEADARPLTGDLGIIFAAIAALNTTERRRAALRRHVWRPSRFKALLDRYTAPLQPSEARTALLGSNAEEVGALMRKAGKFVGARSTDEIEARIAILRDDAATQPISADDKMMIEAVLAVKDGSGAALNILRAMNLIPMQPALDKMEQRLEALARRGIDTDSLPFDAAFGRSLEYYDGFVFEFRSPDQSLPALGGGGRYDALTVVLGGGSGSTAVGGIVRPEAILAARGRP